VKPRFCHWLNLPRRQKVMRGEEDEIMTPNRNKHTKRKKPSKKKNLDVINLTEVSACINVIDGDVSVEKAEDKKSKARIPGDSTTDAPPPEDD